jgi:hypothetical protein
MATGWMDGWMVGWLVVEVGREPAAMNGIGAWEPSSSIHLLVVLLRVGCWEQRALELTGCVMVLEVIGIDHNVWLEHWVSWSVTQTTAVVVVVLSLLVLAIARRCRRSDNTELWQSNASPYNEVACSTTDDVYIAWCQDGWPLVHFTTLTLRALV